MDDTGSGGAVVERSITASYAETHNAFQTAAYDAKLTPFDIRLLVALEERGGTGRTDELARETRVEGAQIRRSSLTLRAKELVVADSADGSPVKRGARARLKLTASGRKLARRAIGHAAGAEG